MFNAIAPRYELVNRLFSGGRDAYWRRRAVELARVTPDDDVLDVACGTGDLARAFAAAGVKSVTGCDFARDMLALAEARSDGRIVWIEADALNLPLDDACYSIVSCAFGVRNFAELDRGLSEMFRVLQPGGRVVILEFTRPSNRLIRGLYEFYSDRVMPRLASWVSGDKSGAYRYLPKSIVSFLSSREMIARLEDAGFVDVSATPLTMGVVTVYVGRKPNDQ
jgi:demethylmenaquinone methyltransferase / 2-methoxy-6-polyprenyl-1,4-benzoquinol methylase